MHVFRLFPHLTLSVFVVILGACTSRPSELPREEAWLVAVKSARLGEDFPAFSRFAHHYWFDVKRGEDDWVRLEHDGRKVSVQPLGDDPFADERWDHEVVVWEHLSGEAAHDVANELLRQTQQYENRDDYTYWPGPNSNTYIARMARRVDGLIVPFHHNAIGKDYARILQVGPTATGTGLELETAFLGVEIGVREGVELHLGQLTFGVGLAPPALKIPFLPLLSF